MCQVEYEDIGTVESEDIMELLCNPSEFASCKEEEPRMFSVFGLELLVVFVHRC